MNKRQKEMTIYAFRRWQLGKGYDTISTAYKNASWNKYKAFYRIENYMTEINGSGLLILNVNSHWFTAGFVGWIDGLMHFIYLTGHNIYRLPLESLNQETGEIEPINY